MDHKAWIAGMLISHEGLPNAKSPFPVQLASQEQVISFVQFPLPEQGTASGGSSVGQLVVVLLLLVATLLTRFANILYKERRKDESADE